MSSATAQHCSHCHRQVSRLYQANSMIIILTLIADYVVDHHVLSVPDLTCLKVVDFIVLESTVEAMLS